MAKKVFLMDIDKGMVLLYKYILFMVFYKRKPCPTYHMKGVRN